MECLLCLEFQQDETKCITVDSTQWKEFNIKTLIDKHLWPIETFINTSSICSACWEELHDFHKFYTRIEKTHNDSKLILKTETDPLQEDRKPKDIFLKTLLEPEIVIGEKLDGAAIEIKQESEEIPVIVQQIAADINKYSDDSIDTFEYDQQYRDPRFDDSSESNDSEDDSDSDHNLPLIRKVAASKNRSPRNKSKSTEDKDDNDDATEEKPATMKKRFPRTKSSSPAAKKNITRKPSNLPKINCVEYDKFLKEHFKITCDRCQQTFEKFRHLCQHYSKEHKEQGYALCCGTKFFNRRLLVDHINFHLNPEYFKCELCGKVLTKRICLIGHMKIHEEKKFACDMCDKKFVFKYKLDKHKLTHMPESEKKFPCNECGNFYANEYILNQHQKAVHLNIYAKVCEICGETLPDSHAFKKHMERHDGIMPGKTAKCEQCGLILTSQQSLKKHVALKHSVGEKCDYKCHICSKVSPNMRALKKHIWEKHELGYQFKCTICEKEFKRSDNLKSHMAMHTGSPLYTCPWCPKTFNSNGNMHQHRKKAHPIEWEKEKRIKYSGNLPPNYKPSSTMYNVHNSAYYF